MAIDKDDNIEQIESKRNDIIFLYYCNVYESLKTGDIVLHDYWLGKLTIFIGSDWK
jgi:hypothetical protein